MDFSHLLTAFQELSEGDRWSVGISLALFAAFIWFVILGPVLRFIGIIGRARGPEQAPPTSDAEVVMRKLQKHGLSTAELARMLEVSKLNDKLRRESEVDEQAKTGPMGGKVSGEALR